MTHIHTAPYFLAGVMPGCITATYGSLPFYLMDDTLQNGRKNESHATEVNFQTERVT